MPQVTLPSTLQDGVEVAFGSDVLANDEALKSVINGGLADDNIAPGANIKGSKLSATPGERVPSSCIEDDAITADKLKDASDGDDALRAVTGDHIRNLTIPKKKLSTSVNERITIAQMDILVEEVPFSFGGHLATLWHAQARRITNGANWEARVSVTSGNGSFIVSDASGQSVQEAGTNQAPTTPIPTLTRRLIGLYLADVAIVAGVCSGKVVFVSMPTT